MEQIKRLHLHQTIKRWQLSQSALTGTEVKYKDNDTNAGLESGYICKLSAKDSTTCHINDSEQGFELPVSWVTVTAVVDTNAKKAAVCKTINYLRCLGGDIMLFLALVSLPEKYCFPWLSKRRPSIV